MADNSLFINIATLLWAMKIERKKDPSGRFLPLDVDGWVDGGFIVLAGFITYHYVDANTNVFCRHPVPFEVKFPPRFPDAPAMLAQERELRGL
jgi:hypothetical protein